MKRCLKKRDEKKDREKESLRNKTLEGKSPYT